jgi:DNA adenine methylase
MILLSLGACAVYLWQRDRLAAALHKLSGMVMLSGYLCDLYRELYGDWEMVQVEAMADGARPRVECMWMNPFAMQKRDEGSIFAWNREFSHSESGQL